jgi:hypothetical protein
MPRFICPCLLAIYATLGLSLHAGAMPHTGLGTHVYAGLFGKVRLPRINVAKGIKAVAYPVTKTAVNGGKAAISGGETAAKAYGTYHSLAPNSKAIPSISRL